jgi:V8-like Glu-specific endopeptidase
MSVNRGYSAATLLGNGTVLIVGGNQGPAEIYNPATEKFRTTGPASMWVDDTLAVPIKGGRVLIDGMGSDAPALMYDSATDSFSNTGPNLIDPDRGAMVLLKSGKVLVVGGSAQVSRANPSGVSRSAEIYDPATNKFTLTGSMRTAREGLAATTLPDGRILVAGGDDHDCDTCNHVFSSAELYDPNSGKFSPTGSMNAQRTDATATLLDNGKVLIAGGQDENGELSSAELYDPHSGKFSLTGSMTVGRLDHTGTLLKDGRVLVAGGDSTIADTTAEIYDPATGKFSPTGQMTADHVEGTATLLSDGRVLIAGGGPAGTSAELYWP